MKKALTLIIVSFVFCLSANSQIIIQGTVKDVTNNEPLVGAFITMKGMTGVVGVAELDGAYSIIVPTPSQARNVIMSVSHLGYVSRQEVVELLPVDDGETVFLNFDLEPDPLSLKEIKVSANKVEEELQDVPIAISVYDAANLEARTVSTPDEAFETVPNMVFDGWLPGRPAISLRGLWTTRANPGIENSLGLYIDDIFQSRSFGYNSTMMDIERVEVLRGPQGTLFGKNTIGGLLNLITEKPKFGKSAALELSGGNFNYLQVRGKGNIQLIENKLALRATAAYRKRDGWLQMDNPEVDDDNKILFYGGRLSLRYKPNDVVDWIVRANYSKDADGEIAMDYRTPADGFDRMAVLEEEKDPRDRRSYHNEPTSGFERDDYQLSSHLDVKLGPALTLTSVTSFFDGQNMLRRDFDNSSVDAIYYGRRADVTTFSQDLRIATPRENRKLYYLFGLYYLNDEVINHDSLAGKAELADVWKVIFQNPNLPISADNYLEYVNVNGQIDGSSYAAYFNTSYEFTERIRFNAGIRYTVEEKSIEYSQVPFSPFNIVGLVVAAPLGVDEPIRRSVTDKVFSGNFGIDLKTTDNTLLYVNYSKGFKGSGFNISINPDPDPEKAAFLYDPEFINSYEFGIKLKANNRFQFNAAAFVTDFQDKQEIASAGTSTFVANAKAIQGQGLEGEFVGIWNRFFKTEASVGFLNMRYLDFPFVDPFTGEQTNLSGNEAVKAPNFTFKFSPELHFPVGADLKLLLRADYNYISKAYNDIYNRENLAREGAGRLNGRLTVSTKNQRLKLSLWGRNLTNKAIFVDGNSFFFGDWVALNPARTMGVELRLNFY